jgi:DUF438 domain-containing protein
MESSNMEQTEILALIVESWDSPVVFVDTNHIIRYMNPAARKHYARFGEVIGKSIFDCHNQQSVGSIKDIFSKLQAGTDEVLYTEDEKRRIYMRSVRDRDGKLAGYYERYEASFVRLP